MWEVKKKKNHVFCSRDIKFCYLAAETVVAKCELVL